MLQRRPKLSRKLRRPAGRAQYLAVGPLSVESPLADVEVHKGLLQGSGLVEERTVSFRYLVVYVDAGSTAGGAGAGAWGPEVDEAPGPVLQG